MPLLNAVFPTYDWSVNDHVIKNKAIKICQQKHGTERDL